MCNDNIIVPGLGCIPAAPVLFWFDMERRGFRLRRIEDDRIEIRPWSRLSDDDLAQLRYWKPTLLSLLAYTDTVQ